MYKIASAIALGLLPFSAFAHPGAHHMSIGAMVAHFASEPFHLGMLLLVIVGGFALAARLNREN